MKELMHSCMIFLGDGEYPTPNLASATNPARTDTADRLTDCRSPGGGARDSRGGGTPMAACGESRPPL
jgi:hypothetical protein